MPPPNPASAAHTRYGQSGKPGLANNSSVPTVGSNSTSAEKIVQLRPPNFAVAKVYGKRRQPPTSVAVAPSKNLSPAENPYTDAGMKSTITDQIDQIEKPTCSAATDQIRLRLAMSLLPASQAVSSSGSQSEITCERPRSDPRNDSAHSASMKTPNVSDLADHARNRFIARALRAVTQG